MPVLVGAAGDVGLDYLAFTGKVSQREALAFPERIDPEWPEVGTRWITVFDPAADMSDLDADCLMAIKARLRPVVAKLAAKGSFRMILVSNSLYNDQLMQCWRAMTVSDPTYASNPEAASSIREACLRHGLMMEQAQSVETEIERDLRDAARF